MQQLSSILLVISLAGLSCQPAPSNPSAETDGDTVLAADTTRNQLSAEESESGWQLLFDGRSVDAWRGYNRDSMPAAGWVAEDGELVVLHPPDPRPDDFGGDIITREKFGNFELSIDFLLSDSANGGIFYFVMEEQGRSIWNNAPEYQLIDEAVYAALLKDFDMDTHRTGDNYDMEASAGQYMEPVGSWNTARIVHQDGKVEHWLNGRRCLGYEVGSEQWTAQLERSKFKEYPNYARAKEGHIGLQDHGHEIRFRNIKIRKLP
ncbi:MAG: hypothetical protein RLY31_2637 [Bacteroidota bacterium]|jgi:hypothetical protein